MKYCHFFVVVVAGLNVLCGQSPAAESAQEKPNIVYILAVYAAAVEHMDANIGRIVKSLRDHAQLDNTLILFPSDNGACAEWDPFGFDLDPDDFQNPAPGHGINEATPGRPNVLHKGDALAAMGGPDSLFSYGCAWANLSNTPLSLYKHYAHEGGIRTPMIAHWPARIKNSGGFRHHLAHVTDVMATCVDVAGAEYPATFGGHKILPLEGRSLLPALLDETESPRTLIFEHERNAAIRVGDWKLVAHAGLGRDGLRADARLELFNVRTDPTEQQDLAAEQPARVETLSRRFVQEARRTLVLPAP